MLDMRIGSKHKHYQDLCKPSKPLVILQGIFSYQQELKVDTFQTGINGKLIDRIIALHV